MPDMHKVSMEESSSANLPDFERAHTSEVSPDRILIGIDLYGLHDGSRIPKDLWEPLLGGEYVSLWDDILKPGESIVITGATVQKILFGGYVYDTKKNRVPDELRSDIDIIVDDPAVRARIAAFLGPLREDRVVTHYDTYKCGIDVVNPDNIMTQHSRALREASYWAQNLPEDIRPQSLNYVDQFEAVYMNIPVEKRPLLDHLLPLQTMALNMSRSSDGNLELTIVDPCEHLTSQNRLLMPTFVDQIERQHVTGQYVGLAYTELNDYSMSYLYLSMLNNMSGVVESKSLAALWALGPVSNIIKDACVKDLQFIGGHHLSYDYDLMYAVLDKIVKGDLILKVSPDDKAELDAKEFLREKVQLAFAEGCAVSPDLAFQLVFHEFPLGDLFSPDIATVFSEWHAKFEPNCFFMKDESDYREYKWIEENFERLSESDRVRAAAILAQGPSVFSLYRNPEEASCEDFERFTSSSLSFGSYIRYQEMLKLLYDQGSVDIEMYPAVPGSVTSTETPLTFREMKKYPTEMSEILGILCWALMWDVEKDRDKIERLVNNWKPSGKIQHSWGRVDSQFNMSVDLNSVISTARRLQKFEKGESNELFAAA